MTELQLSQPGALAAGARSRLYALLALAFRYPGEADCQRLPVALSEAIAHLPFSLGSLGSPDNASSPQPEAYVHAFEVAGPYGPPCLIYEGEYGGGRLKVMEDVIRFYDSFGLQPLQADGRRDRPDHLATELEFMHVLTYLEAWAVEAGEDPTPYRRAQMEFLRFHLLDFVAAVDSRLQAMAVPFYSWAARLAREACANDFEYVRRLLEGSP